MNEQRRNYFRVVYPHNDRPVIFTHDDSFVAIDVSEYGLRFFAWQSEEFRGKSDLSFVLEFTDGEQFHLSGRVLRAEQNEVALQLNNPIPLERIRVEELFLQRYYMVNYQ